MLFLRLSIDAIAFESDRVTVATTRRKWRPPSVQSVSLAKGGLQTITTPLFQVRFSQTRHLRLYKRMIFPMMLLKKQWNEKWQSYVINSSLSMIPTRASLRQSYGCSKKFAESAALHSNDHDSTDSTNEKRRSLVEQCKWLELREVTWKLHGASSCRREQASALRHDDRSSKGAEARLSAGNSWSSTTQQISFARFTAK